MKRWFILFALFAGVSSSAGLISWCCLDEGLARGSIASEPFAAAEIPETGMSGGYASTLINGLTPSPIEFAGRMWRVNAGSTWNKNMDFPVRISPDRAKVRFEIRDSGQNRPKGDKPGKRRSELSSSLYGDKPRLPNATELWGAYSFNHLPWSDPAGMRKTWGGVYGQIHMGSKFGGSPAFAVRRKSDGRLWITTRGEHDPEGTNRYLQRVSFGEWHDVVYAITLDPNRGRVRVWLDGEQIINESNISIGSSYADSYWAFGLYFSGGITDPVSAEYANMVGPGLKSLRPRIRAAPPLPKD